MPPRNPPTLRDTQRKTSQLGSASLTSTTNVNRCGGAARRHSGGRKSSPSPKPSAGQATMPESLPELHSDSLSGTDALEASRILVPSTPFDPSTMPLPPLPIATRLTRIATSPAATTASTQHPTCAQRSQKEPVLTREFRCQRDRRHCPPKGKLH
jgi:hypothetical protein